MHDKNLETLLFPPMIILIQTKEEIKDANSFYFKVADGFCNIF